MCFDSRFLYIYFCLLIFLRLLYLETPDDPDMHDTRSVQCFVKHFWKVRTITSQISLNVCLSQFDFIWILNENLYKKFIKSIDAEYKYLN